MNFNTVLTLFIAQLFDNGLLQVDPSQLFSEYGVLGTLASILLATVAFQFRYYNNKISEKDGQILELNRELKESLTESLQSVTEAFDNVEKLANSVSSLEKAIALADRIDRLNSNK